MTALRDVTIEAGALRLHVVEDGDGPAVLLCHGFPETWRSWRRQIAALAGAGLRAIAPDMRGYGGSSAPAEAGAYTQLHVVGDLVALLDALGIERAAIVGHDWGAVAAWNAALLRPDRFERVAGLSVPYVPRGDVSVLDALRGEARDFYMLQFRRPEMDAIMAFDVEATLKASYHGASGDAAGPDRWDPFAPPGRGRPAPHRLPAWLDAEDFAASVEAFTRTGFRGGLNWYRAIEATFELMAPFKGARIAQPSLFIAGERDPMTEVAQRFIDELPRNAPGLVRSLLLPGVGHWVQQEAADDVNAALLAFLSG